MAKLIEVNGQVSEINGELTLDLMQHMVEGYIEVVKFPFNRDYVLIVNEEGLLEGLKLNKIASELAGRNIVGNAIWALATELK